MRNSVKTLFATKGLFVLAFFSLLLPLQQLSAQVKKPANKPATAKQAPNKPSAAKSAPAKTAANKTSVNKPDVSKSSPNKSTIDKPGTKNVGGKDARADVPGKTNNVNIDNSRKNVNVNVDNSKDIHVNNSHNTSVRRNTRVYSRPPYVYGGRRYNCYHPYYFHPYRPFVWGPMWHPWGFFVATLAATAIIVSIVDNDVPSHADMAANYISGMDLSPIERQLMQSGPTFVNYANNPAYTFGRTSMTPLTADAQYYYDQGVYYLKGGEGYTVVAAPLGAKIKSLPSGYETVVIDDKTTNYYYGGAFYEKRSDGYVVVAPLAGSVVENISEGGEEVKMGDQTFVKFGETYFQPIQKDGKNMYEVADVEEDK